MANKKVALYSKKNYELEELIDKINDGMKEHFFFGAEFKDAILRYLGETKTLLLIYEKWFARTGSYASLVIMLSEFNGSQCADIIGTGGKDDWFSYGTESDFARVGVDILEELGFEEGNDE